MLRILWTAKTGMNATQEKLDVISNNLANVNTTGYKKIDVGFKDLLNESLDKLGNPLNNKDATIGTGAKTSEWSTDKTQGVLQQTSISTDLSIDGEGYFKVITDDGYEAYTRDGSFTTNLIGQIIDNKGNKLEINYLNGYSENNVNFNKDNFLVDKKGQVYLNENKKFIKVGDIPIYTAIGDNSFIAIGNSLYTPSDGINVEKSNNFEIYQGTLEASNVDVGTEFADMIITQRAFELSSKGITTADEMWGMINNMRSN